MAKDVWQYCSYDDLAPGIRRFLRTTARLARFECMPVGMSRYVMEWGSALQNPRRSQHLLETLHRPSDESPVTIRMWQEIQHKGPRPVVLYIHGGGWVLGSSCSHRSFCELIAEQAHCTVFSIDYRRAPEHPYPEALADVETAWHWLQKQLRTWAWQNQPVVVAGDSAGGNMATVLCRRLRDRGEKLPDAQFLLYPVTDLAQDTVSYQKYASGFLLTRSLVDWFLGHYLVKAQRDEYDLSPLRCPDLRGLPPAFIGLASCDILLDEGRAYARRLQEAGVAVTLRIFPDMIHGFASLLGIAEARAAALSCISYLQELFQSHDPIIEETRDEQQQNSNRTAPMET